MFAVRHTKTGLFLYDHHEYGAALQANGFLGFTDKDQAVDFLNEFKHDYTIDGKIVIDEEEYLPEDFVVQ